MYLLKLFKHQRRLFSSSGNLFINHYSVLGVSQTSNLKDIQSSYRRLAKRLHPDANLNRDTNQQFTQINIAYTILTNPVLRKKYDQTLNKNNGRVNNNKITNIRMKMKTSTWYNYYNKMNEKKKKNKRRSAGDIGADRDMEWKQHSEELYTVYWTDALDAWNMQHHIELEQVDPWKLD